MSDPPPIARRTPLYLAAIGLSAFLLFTLELYAGRVVLPAFGGTPAVWTTALCFFSATVFLGYLYAHTLTQRLSRHTGSAVHVGLAILAAAAAVLAPPVVGLGAAGGIPPVLSVLAALALISGAPVLLFSTTTPLLSAWYSQDSSDPWWLYAVSNAASLAALLAYPFLIEPFVPLSSQRVAITAGLAVLTVLLATIVALRPRAAALARTAAEQPAAPMPARRTMAWWVFAAAVPAGLLLATTTHIATDQVSAPLLWIGPLSVYLASFVVAFSRVGPRATRVAERLVPAAATLMWLPYVARISWPPLLLIGLMLATYAVLAVAIHGRLAAERPAEAHLTRFYLLVSAGGLLATTLVALVAPIVFDAVYEFPLLIVAGLSVLATIPGAAAPTRSSDVRTILRETGGRLAPYAAVAAVLLAAAAMDSVASIMLVVVVVVVGVQVIALGRTPRGLAIATAVALAALMLAFMPSHVLRVRTFFGITEVRSAFGGEAYEEIHGTTLHGLQFRDARGTEPTSYFVRSGPLGEVFADVERRKPAGASIGVVGLGVGTMAAYARDADRLSFFEVDPAVIAIARDERYFTYLSQAAAKPRVVVGDGRLSLDGEPYGAFDVLLLDAFSSDAIPAHLLTREAMQTYARTVQPDGVIAFQLTNRHFDLAPAVAATARSIGLGALLGEYPPDPADRERLAAQSSRWLLVGRPAALSTFAAKGWTEPTDGPVLTDDYSDVLRLLRWRRAPAPPAENE
ncbi:MAG: hypothetical protein U1E26_01375 [Coriobacteriia bacterium]|nr:hypothetical protein [Coriobacteriia bacterium]